MPTTTVPTDRPPRQRPQPATLTVTVHDVARYGPAAALILTALTQAGEPTPTTALAAATGLDPAALSGALLDLHRFAVVHSCNSGWWLNEQATPEAGR